MLKRHPYRKLALSLRQSSLSPSSSSAPGNYPRVVGLTASYSFEVDDTARDTLVSLCKDLRITNTATATARELEMSGFDAKGAAAEVLLPATVSPRPRSASLALARTTTTRGVVSEADRKAHAMVHTFLKGKQWALSQP